MSECGAPVFILFWLQINSHSIKIARKYYLPHPSFSSYYRGAVKKPEDSLLSYIWLFLIIYQ